MLLWFFRSVFSKEERHERREEEREGREGGREEGMEGKNCCFGVSSEVKWLVNSYG